MYKVLIIDDSSTIRNFLKGLILSEYPDSTITEAEDGKTAFSLLKSNSFNLIITDLEMENGDGESFVYKMQNNAVLKKKKIIIFSAAKNPGIDNLNVIFVPKSSSVGIIKNQIKKILI